MNRYYILTAIIVLTIALTATVSISEDARISDQDREFMKKAAMGSMLEVKLGQMAQEKAASEAVQDFGERMVDDHSKANAKLKEIASETDVSLPQELDDKHRKKVEEFSSLEGESFDQKYMSDMVKDHKKDIESFQKEVRQGSHPEVTQFAANTVEILQEHYRMAQQIHD